MTQHGQGQPVHSHNSRAAANVLEAVRRALALGLAFLVPLLIDPFTLDAARTTKYLAVQFVAFACLALELFPRKKRIALGWDIAQWPLIGLLLLFLLHVLIDPYLPGAFGLARFGDSIFGRPGSASLFLQAKAEYIVGPWIHHLFAVRYALQYGSFLIWAWLLSRGAFGDRFPQQFVAITCATALPIAGYAILQHLGREPIEWLRLEWKGPDGSEKTRMVSTLGNPLFVADFLAVSIVGLIWHAATKRRDLWASLQRLLPANRSSQGDCLRPGSIRSALGCVAALLSLPVCFVALVLTTSRGAAGVLVIGIALLPLPPLIRSLRRGLRSYLGRSLLALLVLFALTLTSVRFFRPAESAYRTLMLRVRSGMSANDFSVLSRLVIWRVAFRLWQHAPLTGVGIEQFRLRFIPELGRYFKEAPLAANVFHKETAVHANEAHNEYFQYLAEHGVIGVGLFMLMVIVALYRLAAIRLSSRLDQSPADQRFSWLLFCLLAQLLLQCVYAFPLHLPAHALLCFSLIGSATFLWNKGRSEKAADTSRPAVPSWLSPFRWAALPLCLGVLGYTVVLYVGELSGQLGRELLLAGRPDKARPWLENSLRLCPEKGEFAYYYGVCRRRVQPDYRIVSRMMERALHTGNDMNVYVSHAHFLMDRERYQEARLFLEELRDHDVNIRGIHHVWGRLAFVSQDYETAARELQIELRQNRENHMAALLLGTCCRLLGDRVGARRALDYALNLRPHLLGAHLELGRVYEEEFRAYSLALQHYREALRIAREVGDRASTLEIETSIRRLEQEYQ